MNRHLSSTLLALLALAFVSCGDGKDNPAPVGPQFIGVASVTLDRSTIKNDMTKQEQLRAVVQPENANNKTVTWTTSDDTRARVDENGLVTIIGAGKSVITAKESIH